MAEKLDCVVVGAGVVGLAVARALAGTGRDVVVLEAESAIGIHSSSRNSEVIHAGIYYPEESLKARLCIAGKEQLYAFCETRNIEHQRIGKLIVATRDDDLEKLIRIHKQALRNGVEDLRRLTAEEVLQVEPAVECTAALLSPSTGIVDSHGFMLALQGDIEDKGGAVVLESRVSGLAIVDGGFEFDVDGDRFQCEVLVNSAGLWASDVVAGIGRAPRRAPTERMGFVARWGALLQAKVRHRAHVGARPSARATVRYAKGHYFAYQGKSPFRHLVYPVPAGGGLGIHATNDLGGAARFGPDVTWIDSVDYTFDDSRKADFVAVIRTYFPDLDESRLVPAYTGVRPKLHGPGERPADFVIAGERDHGVRGLVNLFGIESPGLTASLAIADYAKKLL